jgi:hypothetical protein
MKVAFVSLIGMVVSRCLAADAGASIRLPPWFGDNAVISQIEQAERGQIVVSGSTTGRSRPEMIFSAWPKKAFQTMSLRNSSISEDGYGWQLASSKLNDAPLPSGPFDVSVSCSEGNRGPRTTIMRTNWLFGSVWLLVVDPDRDSHQMPEPTEEARRRVRVLALEGGNTWRQAGGSWLNLNEAYRQKLPLLCGLPRAFANAIVDRDTSTTIGIVLRRSSAWRPGETIGERIGNYTETAGSRVTQRFRAGLNAAVAANHGAFSGGYDRFEKEKKRLEETLRQLKREGKVGKAIPKSDLKWQRALPGDQVSNPELGLQPLVPFRVTGVIW